MLRSILVSAVLLTNIHAQPGFDLPSMKPLHRNWFGALLNLRDAQGLDVVVNTKRGAMLGRRNQVDSRAGGEATSVDWFLGVPYAKPPIGNRRFRPPEPVDSWTDVFNATRIGAVCPQRTEKLQFLRKDEDCLFLNIYSPYQNGSGDKQYPVMLYIHGGSYYVGSGASYPGYVLAQHGVVVVTINYRLGPLGFLCARHSSLPGNYGLLDQVEAIKWVHENIAVFRGNPHQITIFGNSAGSSSVGLMAITPLARGMLQYAIGQSGSSVAFWAVHEPHIDVKGHTREYATSLRCYQKSFSDIADCLRMLTWREITHFPDELTHISPTHVDFKPCVDGHVLTAMPRDMMKEGHINVAGYITGIVRDEWSANVGWLFNDMPNKEYGSRGYARGMHRGTFEDAIDHVVTTRLELDQTVADAVKQEYTNWQNVTNGYENRHGYINFMTDISMVAPSIELAGLFHERSVPVYVYAVEHCARTTYPKWWGCYHTIELNYVFGTPFTGAAVQDDRPTDFTDVDRDVSRRFLQMWSNYAKTGDPSIFQEGVRWKQFLPETSDYLLIDSHSAFMRQHLRAARVAFWNDFVPRVQSRVNYLLGVRRPPSLETWVMCVIAGVLAIFLMVCAIVALRLRRKLAVYKQGVR